MSNRTIIITLLVVFIGFGVALLVLFSPDEPDAEYAETSPAPTPGSTNGTTVISPTSQLVDNAIVTEGRVVPVRSVALNFNTGSTFVDEVLVNEGDTVQRGDTLARLDIERLRLQVEEARAVLAETEALRQRLLEGATPEEIEQARARLAGAQANMLQAEQAVTAQDIAAAQAELEEARVELAEVQAGPRGPEVAAAQAELEAARADLADLEAGPDAADLQVARANLEEAQARLQQTRDSLSAAKTNARLQLENVANTLRDRQGEYSLIYWENQEQGKVEPEDRQREEQARRAVETAEQELEQARVQLEEAEHAERTGVQAAEAEVQRAQARLDQLLAGAETNELAAARAQVAEAEARLDRLLASTDQDEQAAARARVAAAEANLARLQGPQRAGELEIAAANIAEAQANLAQATADPSPADLASVEARVQRAQVAVQQAELDLNRGALVAPIDGTVAEVNIAPGELFERNTPAIIVADFMSWKIEATGLSELNIVHIRVGNPVVIRFFALPDLELEGIVTRIKPLGENVQDETTYTVVVMPLEWDERLRWNMTARLAIEANPR
jgi:HlyD family secretion protein